MGCERGHPRACLHAGVMDTFEPGVPITLTGDEEFQILPTILSRTLFFENTFHKIRHNFNSEQEGINVMYNYDLNSKNIIKILDHNFLGSVSSKEICKEAWLDRPAPTHPWTKDSFLLHLTGLSNKKRIEMLHEYYREYL